MQSYSGGLKCWKRGVSEPKKSIVIHSHTNKQNFEWKKYRCRNEEKNLKHENETDAFFEHSLTPIGLFGIYTHQPLRGCILAHAHYLNIPDTWSVCVIFFGNILEMIVQNRGQIGFLAIDSNPRVHFFSFILNFWNENIVENAWKFSTNTKTMTTTCTFNHRRCRRRHWWVRRWWNQRKVRRRRRKKMSDWRNSM